MEKTSTQTDKTAFIKRIGIVVLSLLFSLLIVSRFIYPFAAGTWESFNWMPAEHLFDGKNPYAFAFESPFGMSPYGIIFYFLIGIGVKIFGYQFWFGRTLSVVAFAVCLWAIVQITRKVSLSKNGASMAFLAGLAMFPAQIWIGIMRPDLIAVAFAFSALAFAFGLEEEKKTSVWRVVGIILFSGAAFFTKQTFVLGAGIIFLRFLQVKKWREAIIYAGGLTVLVFGGMFLLNYSSDGGYFWQHFTHAQRLPYSFRYAAEVFIEILKQPAFFFALVYVAIFSFQKRGVLRGGNFTKIICSPLLLVFFYLSISLLLSIFSAGRVGGNANYYIEVSFVLAIVCGLILSYFSRKENLPNLAAAMIILLTLGGAFQIFRVLRGEYFRWESLNYYREIYETAGKNIPKDGKCISVYPELVVWNGCKFNFDDFEEYTGTWSPELTEIFEREIRQSKYSAIIWTDDKFAERFPNYRLVPMTQKLPERYYKVYLYVPKEKP